MDERELGHVFDHYLGDWRAECLVCRVWVSTSNPKRQAAQLKLSGHLHREHPDA